MTPATSRPHRFDQFDSAKSLCSAARAASLSTSARYCSIAAGMQCDDIDRVGAFQLGVDVGALDFERLDPWHQGGEVDTLRYRVDQALEFA
jgi:hypothetical protein